MPKSVLARLDIRTVIKHKIIKIMTFVTRLERSMNFRQRRLLKRLALTPTPGYRESKGEGCASGVAVAVTPTKHTLPFRAAKSAAGFLPVASGNLPDM